MNVIIDPLTRDGTFDNDYYESSDYKIESNIVLRYLKLEGFMDDRHDFKIVLLDRLWWVTIP